MALPEPYACPYCTLPKPLRSIRVYQLHIASFCHQVCRAALVWRAPSSLVARALPPSRMPVSPLNRPPARPPPLLPSAHPLVRKSIELAAEVSTAAPSDGAARDRKQCASQRRRARIREPSGICQRVAPTVDLSIGTMGFRGVRVSQRFFCTWGRGEAHLISLQEEEEDEEEEDGRQGVF